MGLQNSPAIPAACTHMRVARAKVKCGAAGRTSAVDLKFLQLGRKLSQELQIQKPH
jgi:hypothetical protein